MSSVGIGVENVYMATNRLAIYGVFGVGVEHM
jgi:hypothetical protein